MQVDNVKVYDLEECIIAGGLPMLSSYDKDDFLAETEDLRTNMKKNTSPDNKHISRSIKLANNEPASGHCNFLKGILVACNVTATQAWWLQAGRYGHFTIDSSMSKMHRLKKMDMNSSCHQKTPENSKQEVEKLSELGDIESLIYACPMGLELTARVNTNYMQLRIMYNQRKNHRLSEWKTFCSWIETLPLAKKLITCDKN